MIVPYYQYQDIVTLYHSDCLPILQGLPADHLDALVTDPPAGIGFMGRIWDGDKGGRAAWVAWAAEIFAECVRVCKPGAHGLVWALPRTSHWTAWALEDAGWEIRDCVYHLFATGFPKSLDISKALDKDAGAARPVTGQYRPWADTALYGRFNNEATATEPITDLATQWAGWGTALKPAVECWWLVRKPLSEHSIAANVARWGTGAINIDGGRVGTRADAPQHRPPSASGVGNGGVAYGARAGQDATYSEGRWPPHLLLSHSFFCTPAACWPGCPVAEMDAQSGLLQSGYMPPGQPRRASLGLGGYGGGFNTNCTETGTYGDTGGASRFYPTFWPGDDLPVPFCYAAKASPAERNAGCDYLPLVPAAAMVDRAPESAGLQSPRAGAGRTGGARNHHPTVKSQALMRWLVRLVTPPGGTVGDPFMGSGSTGVACVAEGARFVGCEQDTEHGYLPVAQARIVHALGPLFAAPSISSVEATL